MPTSLRDRKPATTACCEPLSRSANCCGSQIHAREGRRSADCRDAECGMWNVSFRLCIAFQGTGWGDATGVPDKLENAASKHGTKQKLITRVCPEYVVITSGKALQASLHDRSPVMEAASRRTCKGIANSMSKEQTASQCRNCLSLAGVLLPPSQRRFSRVPADTA